MYLNLFDFQEHIEVIPAAVMTPQFICESGGTSLQIDLEPNSDLYDFVVWEQSIDGGLNWSALAETPSSFENVNTNTLEILNVPKPMIFTSEPFLSSAVTVLISVCKASVHCAWVRLLAPDIAEISSFLFTISPF